MGELILSLKMKLQQVLEILRGFQNLPQSTIIENLVAKHPNNMSNHGNVRACHWRFSWVVMGTKEAYQSKHEQRSTSNKAKYSGIGHVERQRIGRQHATISDDNVMSERPRGCVYVNSEEDEVEG
jgi:hypothetical protein